MAVTWSCLLEKRWKSEELKRRRKANESRGAVHGVVESVVARFVPHLGIQAHILRVTQQWNRYLFFSQVLHEGDNIHELFIVFVVNERNALDSVLGLEFVARCTIVDHDDRVQIAAQQSQVLHEHSFGAHTVIPK